MRHLPLLAFFLAFTIVYSEEESCPSRSDNDTWAFIPCESHLNNADPIARVFNDRLYVYTSWDHADVCGNINCEKKQGYQQFCMPGYRVYSTGCADLRHDWTAHGAVLREEDVPWVHKGDDGFKGSARMWAPEVVQGDDRKFYLFFPASHERMDSTKIGVACSDQPTGPFVPRHFPIEGLFGIDPSVIRLPGGDWVIFTSGGGRGEIFRGLLDGYKEGPHAEIRGEKLMLFYSHTNGGGYTIQQAGANDMNNPEWGFWHAGESVATFDGRTNHASTVTFKRRHWMFYHRHLEEAGARWARRRVVFSAGDMNEWGKQKTISPYFRNGQFFVNLPYNHRTEGVSSSDSKCDA